MRAGEDILPIIPKPIRTELAGDSLLLNDSMKIIVSGNRKKLMPVAEELAQKLRTATGYGFEIGSPQGGENAIVLAIDTKLKPLGDEGYTLDVNGKGISIKSVSPAGIFYGIQTLLQLLPTEADSGEKTPGAERSIPCLTIEDEPRFSWRGMHLDVGRHFAPPEFVKKYIDLLASYKMNMFHWHLTEDQGWRIEIKKYPKLTEIGSKRKESMGNGTPHGGYYTQDEIKDVVKYAASRFITVVPEIEMPGHSLAALAAYPELSCTGGPFETGTIWGVYEDVYCAGSEKTFTFLKDVLQEVTALFPGEFFHIGGDECPKVRWKKCPKCQKRMKVNGLKSEEELQSYFIKRLEKVLKSRGKRLVGWDEILEGGLPKRATVMSWRGTEGGTEAAKSGHDVVMTPTSHCYFDYYQGKPEDEPPAIGGYLPIETVYAFEPVPENLEPGKVKHILGAQGNVWTEWMPDTRHVEYMVLPRMLAMSEVVWSEKSARDLKDFSKRLEKHYPRLSSRGYNFRLPPELRKKGE